MKKLYKKGKYEDRFIIDKILSPLFKDTSISIGIFLTIGRIIKEQLLTQNLTRENLENLKELAQNPDIPFMMRAISDNKDNARCFLKNFGFNQDETEKAIEKNAEIVYELIQEKNKVISLISK